MPQFTIIVTLLASTQSGLTPATVHQLRQQIAAIYGDAGVKIQWAEKPMTGAVVVSIVRALPPISGCESAFGCSVIDRLGTTPPVAYIASEAIRQEELRNPFLRRRMLAYVAAHEVGHLIGLEHTHERGIMHRNSEWLPNVTWTPAERIALSTILTSGRAFAARLNADPR